MALTKDALRFIYAEQEPPNPVLQIIKALVTTPLHPRFEDGTFTTGSIVRLDEYMSNAIHNTRIIVVMRMEAIGRPVPQIGSPVLLDAARFTSLSAHSALNTPHGAVAAPVQQTVQQKAKQDVFTPQPVAHTTRPAQPLGENLTPDGSAIHPISSLTPYNNRWTIRARVTFKSPIKHWESARGKGTVASVDLLDESGEIRCVLFTEAVDKFYELFKEGSVYFISKGSIKQDTKDRRFSSIKNDYEMSLSSHSDVQLAPDDTNVPLFNVSAVPLSDIMNHNPNDVIDIIGIIANVGDLGEITTRKDGRQLSKRVLTLADETNTTIELTLWGDEAAAFNAQGNPVAVVKNVRVSDFAGRTLNASNTTHFIFNPNTSRANELRQWWAKHDPGGLVSLSQRSGGGGSGGFGNTPIKTLAEGRQEQLGKGDQPSFFISRVTIMLIKHDENAALYYNACPSEGCNKKVTQNERGLWHCPKCNREYDSSEARYILSLLVSDHTGSEWVNAFNNEGQLMLGRQANEIRAMREKNDPTLGMIFEETLFASCYMKIKAHEEMYNDDNRLKMTVVGVQALDYVDSSRQLLEKIHQFA